MWEFNRESQLKNKLAETNLIIGAESQNRTGDTRIFSPLLYQLSYLGTGR